MTAKKIIFICRRFNSDKWGGTETVVIQTAKQLGDAGFEVQIFTTKALSSKNEEYIDGIKVRRFSFCLPWFGLSDKAKESLLHKGGNLLSLSMLWALLKERNVSLIHLHSTHRIGAVGRTAARIKKIPYVVSLHGGLFSVPSYETDALKEPFKGKVEWGKIFGFLLGSRKLLTEAKTIICVGEEESRAASKEYPDNNIAYIPNGVNLDKFESADENLFRKKYGISAGKKIILCVSRIDYQKNQLLLLKSFAKIHKADSMTHLVLIGSITVPDYFVKMLDLSQELGISSSVTFIPGLSPDSPLLYSAFKTCDIFVLPTLHEPFGIVVLEAWAASKPVVASRIGGIPGFTEENKDCILVKPDNQNELTSAIQKVLSDQELRRKLAQNGYSKARMNYNWQIITDKLLEIYDL